MPLVDLFVPTFLCLWSNRSSLPSQKEQMSLLHLCVSVVHAQTDGLFRSCLINGLTVPSTTGLVYDWKKHRPQLHSTF